MSTVIAPPDRVLDIEATDGRRLRVAVDDRGDAAEPAVPLVLVHGFTGGRVDWAEVIDDLAADRRVVAWDHRGHADSTSTGVAEGYSFDQLVADAEQVVDALALDRFHLLGHSMGGIVAMNYTLRNPGRVVSLLAMDTMAEPGSSIPEAWIDHVVTTGRDQGMGAVAEMMASYAESSPTVPDEARNLRVVARMRHKLTNMDVEAFEHLGRGLRTFEPFLDRLAAIDVPTTVIVGEHDTPLLAAAENIAAAVPGATHVVVPDAHHCPQDENTEAWLATVRAHLARADGTPGG